MPKRVSKSPIDSQTAEQILNTLPTDAELTKTDLPIKTKKLSKSTDIDSYKKQQFYCEIPLLQRLNELKVLPHTGDLSDMINDAIREYLARLDTHK